MLRRSVVFLTVLLWAGGCLPAQTSAAVGSPAEEVRPRNVLFLIADDLTASVLGCYGHAGGATPTIDALAARGLRFERAYCDFPVCGPARAALMSGLCTRTLGILGNGGAGRLEEVLGKRPTLPEWFRRAGFHTARVGKIFHMRVPGDITAGVHGPDHAASWTERHSLRAPEWQSDGEAEHLSREKLRFETDRHYNLGFGTAFYCVQVPGDGIEQHDAQAAAKAVEILEQRAAAEEPFFLAVGFVRPHVPLVAPAELFAAHPPEQAALPARVEADLDDIPAAGRTRSEAQWGLEDVDKQRRVHQAYLASTAFLDAQVARVLGALHDLGLADDTLVVFTSDHGYHLGEHGFWQKLSLHEESARVPLLVAGPGVTPGVAAGLVQAIDLYPTLVEAAGLDRPEHLQGASLLPMLRDPEARVHDAVFATRGSGDLVRTEDWALLAWEDGSRELYDMRDDPRQFRNLAGRSGYEAEQRRLEARLERWRSSLGDR